MTVILFVSLYLSSLLFAVGTRAVPKDNEDNALKVFLFPCDDYALT